MNLLASLRGTREKVVLVSHWTKTLDLFELLFESKSYPFTRLDGSTPSNVHFNKLRNDKI